MRHRLVASAWFVLLLAESGFARGGGPSKDTSPEAIAGLIDKLGAPLYADRETAGRDLIRIGEPALAPLRAAEKHLDAEVQARVPRIVRSILLALRDKSTIGMKMVLVEAGEFEMGSFRETGRRPDETLHPVRLTRPFLLGAYELTQDEYEKVMTINPSAFSAKGNNSNRVRGLETGRFPVESLTWFDAVEFCNRLSKKEGYVPCYELTRTRVSGHSIVDASVKYTATNGYRLPTEAEWEFACRAWTRTSFFFGRENSGKEANLRPGPAVGYGSAPDWPTLGRTTTVGSYKPNPWGLYDMHGNAAEWCHDWYLRDYPNSKVFDPIGPTDGYQRVVRGGSWMVNEQSCRSASRFFLAPEVSNDNTGFRVARSP